MKDRPENTSVTQGGTVASAELNNVAAKNAIAPNDGTSGSAPQSHGRNFLEINAEKFGYENQTPSNSQYFNQEAHDVNLRAAPFADLRHPRDIISHAIDRHSPNSNWENKTRFDSFGELHKARSEWLNQHSSALQSHTGTRFFEETKVSGQTYKFGFEYNNGKWREITGYPVGNKKS